MGGAGGAGGATDPAGAAVQPEAGTPSADSVLSQRMYAKKAGAEENVPVKEIATPSGGKAVMFTSKMAIDADGSGGLSKTDKTGTDKTSLHYSNGESLNPGTIPFIVVPTDFRQSFPLIDLGDYAAVSYSGRTAYAIIGDHGPRGVVGEGSVALARSLGIPSDANRGGADGGVQYLIFPQSRDSEPSRSAASIQTRGRALRTEAGLEMAKD
jgi:hypothetical protein